MYNINRRKFLGLFGCGCCSAIFTSCSTVPITERKQLSIIPEAKLNAQAAKIYEKVKKKEKLSKDTKTLNLIKDIGQKMEDSMKTYLLRKPNYLK